MGYRPGSRKAQVHELFVKKGPNAAETLGQSLGLAEGTVRSWIRTWFRGEGPAVTQSKDLPTDQREQDKRKGWWPDIPPDKMVLADGRRCYRDSDGVFIPVEKEK